jgi:hypothetical protein
MFVSSMKFAGLSNHVITLIKNAYATKFQNILYDSIAQKIQKD